MTQQHEIPSDDQVIATLHAKGNLSPHQLVAALAGAGFDDADSILAIQRCLNRGLIHLDPEMNLKAAPQKIAA